MSAAFYTLKLADKLESAGFTPEQACGTSLALSEALTADLATKSDLTEVRSDLTEVRSEITAVRAEMRAELTAVRAEITILKWIGGFTLALLVAVAIKLFVH